jgi:hypothetical protein
LESDTRLMLLAGCLLCLEAYPREGTPARAAKANVLVLSIEQWGLSVRACLSRVARREAGCWMCRRFQFEQYWKVKYFVLIYWRRRILFLEDVRQ